MDNTDREKADRCALSGCPLAGQNDPRCAKCTGPVQWKDKTGHKHGMGRSCTNCPMNGLCLPVCYAACPGPNKNFATDGKSVVTLGGMEDPTGFLEKERERLSIPDKRGLGAPTEISADDQEAALEIVRGLAARPASVLRLHPIAESACLELLRIIASFNQTELLLVHGLLNGRGQVGTAKALGITKQATNATIKRLERKHPLLAPFLRHNTIDDFKWE